jgi:DNA-binding CsgD family transcriptional regulator
MREDDILAILTSLTPKQRQVLDLLIQHKTSKEIARELGISPHTVDQRVQFAKEKLGVDSRSEAAVEYRRLLQLADAQLPERHAQISGPFAYEESRSAEPAVPLDEGPRRTDEYLIAPKSPEWSKPDENVGRSAGYSVVPEMFEGRYGTLMRLGAIVTTTVLLLFIVLGGVVMFDQLSRGFAG